MCLDLFSCCPLQLGGVDAVRLSRYSRKSLSLLAWAYLELGEVDQTQALLAQMVSTLVQALHVQTLVFGKEEH